MSVQEYKSFLDPHCAPGFSSSEIVKLGNRKFELPPERMWPRIVRPLHFANLLRRRMMENHKARGLLCAAAFRPKGGAASSRHKHNDALDLDLIPGNRNLTVVYYEEAVRLWCEFGRTESFGLGLYCPADTCQGIRVHIDIGYYTRTWQHGRKTGVSDAILIARKLGLVLPTKKLLPGQSASMSIHAVDEGSDDGDT